MLKKLRSLLRSPVCSILQNHISLQLIVLPLPELDVFISCLLQNNTVSIACSSAVFVGLFLDLNVCLAFSVVMTSGVVNNRYWQSLLICVNSGVFWTNQRKKCQSGQETQSFSGAGLYRSMSAILVAVLIAAMTIEHGCYSLLSAASSRRCNCNLTYITFRAVIIDSTSTRVVKTRKLCYRKDYRAMRAI